jgi:pimeloyl-ACP methyl ester carboxylesterase
MSDPFNPARRQFMSAATLGAMALGATRSVVAGSGKLPTIAAGTHNSFASPLKQVKAGQLNVGYIEAGPAKGPTVILIHGWPYDIYSFVDVTPLLAAAGYRVIVPYLRGYSTTRFLSADAVRNGQPSALAHDIVDFMDALQIQKAILAGFDWGARTADIVAALWPERCRGLVSVSGYLIGSQAAWQNTAAAASGTAVVVSVLLCDGARKGRVHEVSARILQAHLATRLSAVEVRRCNIRSQRRAFDNPDHVDIVIHNYRWRLGLVEGEARYDDFEHRLAAAPKSKSRHARGRCQRRSASTAIRLREEVRRQV